MPNSSFLVAQFTEADKQRFLLKVLPKNANGCMEWGRYKDKDGYGRFQFKKYPLSSHRVAYELNFGSIPIGMCVCHSCDNPSCCNPAHLWLGTTRENTQDKVSKGRIGNIPRGEQCHSSKMNSELVVEMRKRYSEGETIAELTRIFGLNCHSVHNIVKRISWKHIK